MILLMQTLLQPEQSPLGEAIELATEPRQKMLEEKDEVTEVGLGWMTTTKNNNKVIWHNGSTGNSSSFIGVNKVRNKALLLLFNKALPEEITEAGLDYLTSE